MCSFFVPVNASDLSLRKEQLYKAGSIYTLYILITIVLVFLTVNLKFGKRGNPVDAMK
jgi:hypothetical protein